MHGLISVIIPQTKNPTNVCEETCLFVPSSLKRTEGHYTGRISLNSYLKWTIVKQLVFALV